VTTPDPGSAAPSSDNPWLPRSAVPTPGTPADRQWAAFIGPRWPTYRRKFVPFFDEARFTPTWNWAAALFTPMWFLYRKLYLPFVVFFFLPTVVFQFLWREDVPQTVLRPGDPLPPWFMLQFGVQLSAMILAGGTANYLLFRRGSAALRVLADRGAPPDQTLPLLGRVGGTNRGAVAFMIALIGVGLVMMIAQGGTAP
jgi:hypothetical protein